MPGTSPEAPRKTTSPPATPEAQDTYPVVGGPQRRPLPRASPPAEVKGAAPGAQSLKTRLAHSTPTPWRERRAHQGRSQKLSFLPGVRLAGPAARPEPTPRVAGQTLFTLSGGC